jgi:hypothetical protein
MPHYSLPMMGDHSSSTRFRALFESALQDYGSKTGVTLAEHPLGVQLQNCNSLESVTSFLQHDARNSIDFHGRDKITKSIESIVSVLFALSTTPSLGEAIGLVCQNALMACSAYDVFFSAIPTCKSNTCWPRYPTYCVPSLVPNCVSL